MCRGWYRRRYCAGWWCGKFLGTVVPCFDSYCCCCYLLLLWNSSVCPALSLSVVACRVIVAPSPADAATTLPAGRAQASDVFERLKLAQSSADELGDDRPRSELDPTIAGWKAVGGLVCASDNVRHPKHSLLPQQTWTWEGDVLKFCFLWELTLKTLLLGREQLS